MTSITAVLHTSNDARQLGRALETLYPCDEILIIDHHSHDATVSIAREYGAHVIDSIADAAPGDYLQKAGARWILCLEPRESLTEALAASLYEWKADGTVENGHALNIYLQEESAKGWIELPTPETRLIPKTWTRWERWLPAYDHSAPTLEGALLRFMESRMESRSL